MASEGGRARASPDLSEGRRRSEGGNERRSYRASVRQGRGRASEVDRPERGIKERRPERGLRPESSDRVQTIEFEKILEVPREERDRVQRMQVIDRAAAAIAAARAILDQDSPQSQPQPEVCDRKDSAAIGESEIGIRSQDGGKLSQNSYNRQTRPSQIGTPGPDFWSWVPPPGNESLKDGSSISKTAQKPSVDANQMSELLEKYPSADILRIPLESKLYESKITSSLPPLQSWLERGKMDDSITISENAALNKNYEIQFTEHAAEAARALDEFDESPSHGTYDDGSMWWRDFSRTPMNQIGAGFTQQWQQANSSFGYKLP